MKSWKPSVLVSREWATNALRFATKEEAEASALDLMSRWILVQGWRADESEDEVNYRMDLETGKIYRLDEQGQPVGDGWKPPRSVTL